MASTWSWVTYTVVMPSRAWSAAIWVRVDTRSFASRLDSGSSIRNTLGSRTIARPIATRCRWPPDSAAGLRSKRLFQVEQLRCLVDAAVSLLLRGARDLQRKPHVLANGHVRVQGVVLEDHRDVAFLGRQPGHVTVADPDAAPVDELQAGQHPKAGGLPAAGRAHQHQELAVLDVQVEPVDCRAVGAGKQASRRVERHCRHRSGSFVCQGAGCPTNEEPGVRRVAP